MSTLFPFRTQDVSYQMESALQSLLRKAKEAICEDLQSWLTTRPEIVSIEVRLFYWHETDYRVELTRLTGLMDVEPDYDTAYGEIQDYFNLIGPIYGFKSMIKLLCQYGDNHFSVKNLIHEK